MGPEISKRALAYGLVLGSFVSMQSCNRGRTNVGAEIRPMRFQPLTIDVELLTDALSRSHTFQSLGGESRAAIEWLAVELSEQVNRASTLLDTLDQSRTFGSSDNFRRQHLAIAQVRADSAMGLATDPLLLVPGLDPDWRVQTAEGEVHLVPDVVYDVAEPYLTLTHLAQVEFAVHYSRAPMTEQPAMSDCVSFIGQYLFSGIQEYGDTVLRAVILP